MALNRNTANDMLKGDMRPTADEFYLCSDI